jgi:hypothetical protein
VTSSRSGGGLPKEGIRFGACFVEGYSFLGSNRRVTHWIQTIKVRLLAGNFSRPPYSFRMAGPDQGIFRSFRAGVFAHRPRVPLRSTPGLNFSNAFGVLKFPWRYAHQDLQISQRRHAITGCKNPGLLSAPVLWDNSSALGALRSVRNRKKFCVWIFHSRVYLVYRLAQ